MPIMLDNLQTVQTVAKTYSPKFFDKELTGVGKKSGVLSEMMNPAFQASLNKPAKRSSMTHMRHMQYTNGNTTTFQIPVAVVYPKLLNEMNSRGIDIKMPELTEMVKVGNISTKQVNGDVYFYMRPCHIGIEKIRNVPPPGSSASVSISRHVTVKYTTAIYIVTDANDPFAAVNASTSSFVLTEPYVFKKNGNTMVYLVTDNPGEVVNGLPSSMPSVQFDGQALTDYFDKYDLYGAVCKCSEEWQSTIHKTFDGLFDTFSVDPNQNLPADIENIVSESLRYLENYNVPLDLYREIYKSILTHYAPTVANRLCKQNLNLLLSDTLNDLNNSRANLSPIPANGPAGIAALSGKRFSPEQQRAIASQSPLSLVQAGAGTGKSTVILGRIDWMIASGVKPEDIMVLSFTNAAADHIKDRNPDVHSMTIAKMIHTIYSANYPTHELSTLETIINSLDIYFPTDDTARRLGILCRDISKNARHSFTTINNFIEDNFDAVINILNTMGQTSLELEIMICYQQIENLIEPNEVLSRHLIIDEVQDNSVFEFIYTLKYVNKHKESLFIVGDCSQTLYEFRASDPRALNVLEGSGVFDSYQLQVNYRSNQEILDFANVTLANIEANQYANIRLRANSLQQVTEQSFSDKVRLKYYRLKKFADFNPMIPIIVGRDLRSYIDACLARGEQVAVLSYERFVANRFGEEISRIWPNATVASLMPNVPKENTILSRFIKDHWDEVQFMPTKNITDIIIRACIDSLAANPRGSQAAQAKNHQIAVDILLEWQSKVAADLTQLQTAHMNGLVSLDDFLDEVKKSMLTFEIQRNAVKQALVSQKNREAKLQNSANDADFVLSTIHSAKGLEFDNVIVIYRNDRTDEDEKRMYYVALTRAMKSEFIVAYDTVAKPNIELAHANIIQTLHQIAPKRQAADVVAKAQAFLAANASGALVSAIDGMPDCNFQRPEVSDLIPTIVYTTQQMTLADKDMSFLPEKTVLTRVDDMQTMLIAAHNIVDAANTRGEVIIEDERAEDESESA